MPHPYSAFCDDFYVNMRLGSQMPLTLGRESVLHFFEQMQKAYPTLVRFRRGEAPDYSIEEDREAQTYRWVSLEMQRLSSGHVNPPSVEEAMKLHRQVLEMAPYDLGIRPVELEYLDILFGFDLPYAGNHDELIAETLFEQAPLAGMLELAGGKLTECQPSITIALDSTLRLQARLDVVSRSAQFAQRKEEFGDEAISVYLTVRRMWGDRISTPLSDLAATLAEKAEQIVSSYVLPRIVRPISDAIQSRS